METVAIKNMCGGTGEVVIKHILGERELHGKCGLYAEVTINAGSSLGYHEHHGESETYYILSGEGIYDDNGTKRSVKAGDVVCVYIYKPPYILMSFCLSASEKETPNAEEIFWSRSLSSLLSRKHSA